mmetsp:Transcript_32981/g.65610  ORF Transcript_32981/g.65610 Transcript_32981/m.65610 type:complete len:195 (-) Transcript_32981:50-634(-)
MSVGPGGHQTVGIGVAEALRSAVLRFRLLSCFLCERCSPCFVCPCRKEHDPRASWHVTTPSTVQPPLTPVLSHGCLPHRHACVASQEHAATRAPRVLLNLDRDLCNADFVLLGAKTVGQLDQRALKVSGLPVITDMSLVDDVLEDFLCILGQCFGRHSPASACEVVDLLQQLPPILIRRQLLDGGSSHRDQAQD